MYRIFIVEDDPVIAEAIAAHLTSWGCESRCVSDFRHVAEEFSAFSPHLVLLDISLPFFNGYYWCAELRRVSQVPILFLSSASDNMNIVMAVNMGGDDFLAKPFDLSVLTAKVQALLRRSYDFAAAPPLLSCRGAVLDDGDCSVHLGGRSAGLTKNEYRILHMLFEEKGHIVERGSLMARLWESDSFVDENTLSVNVARLRRKLEELGLCEFIITKKGLGYIVEDQE